MSPLKPSKGGKYVSKDDAVQGNTHINTRIKLQLKRIMFIPLFLPLKAHTP